MNLARPKCLGRKALQVAAGVAGMLKIAASTVEAGEPPGTLPIYFSVENPGVLPPIPNPGPDNYPNLSTPAEWTQQANPILSDSARIYVWANMGGVQFPDQCWRVISFNIDADGPVTISNLTIFNANHFFDGGISGRRWGYVITPPLSADGTEFVDVEMVATETLGLCRPLFPDGYVDGEPGNALLGYFDATYVRLAPASIWLENGVNGVRLDSFLGHEHARYGFGDASIDSFLIGRRSELPEITFVPEPTTLLLIVAGIAPILRRRRA